MPKVLLVEDDNNLKEIFQMRLQAEGYTTVAASDGEEGLVVAMKEKPDLVIADVMMPKLSGFEMIESLRAAPETKDIKVVMMTALGQAEDQARGEKLGVVKYLVKSQVTLEDFARVVKETLGPGDPNVAAAPAKDETSKNNQQESELSMQDQPTPTPAPADGAGGAPAGDTPAPAPDAGAPAPNEGGATSDQQTTAQESGVVADQVNNFASSTPAGDTPAAPAPDTGGSMPAPDVPPSSGPAAPAGDSGGSDAPAAPPSDSTSNAL